ncbi:caspase family protein [Runella sp. MFBS21]|uniref:caspase family protein n=1 Tax=Runella sp. MFBS21 TaxID=3034018 RepID=UPI0023F98492|nr:caspase family protein [Runella sp. MFBS21]MDF7821816.1 caspase family protein [Runella sp. MFBS21]
MMKILILTFLTACLSFNIYAQTSATDWVNIGILRDNEASNYLKELKELGETDKNVDLYQQQLKNAEEIEKTYSDEIKRLGNVLTKQPQNTEIKRQKKEAETKLRESKAETQQIKDKLNGATAYRTEDHKTRVAVLTSKFNAAQEEAREAYNQALTIDPNHYEALFNLGVIYFNEAVELKKKVDNMDMKTYNANGRGVESQVYGLFLAAKPYFDRASKIKEEDDLTNVLSSLSSVIEQFNQKGIKPIFPSNTQNKTSTYSQKSSTPAYNPPPQTAPSTYNQPTTSVGQNRVALVIGNSAYTHGSQLNNLPVNDAQDMANRLRELGFKVTTVTNGTQNKLMDAFRQFSKSATEADVALFFYAGHGIEAEGINYLVPIDARLDAPADARFESISLNMVLDEMKRFKTKINLVYLDACRNNPFRSWNRDTGNRGFVQVGRLAQSTKVYYATQPGDVAQNGAGRNGMFTTALLRHLKKGVEIEDLMRQVTNEVNKNTNGNQLPFAAGTLFEKFEF